MKTSVKPSILDSDVDPFASEWLALDPLPEVSEVGPETFPVYALGPLLGAAVAAIARDVQAPESLAGGAVLAASSLATSPLANVLLPHGQRSPLSVYIASSAGSGDRKSAADAVACHEVEELRKQQSRDYITLFHQFEAEKANWKKGDKTPECPAPSSITTGNATTEGICRILKKQSVIGVFSAEGGEMLAGHSMRDERRSASLAFYLKAWSGESLDSLRSGDGLTVLLGRRISMHLMVQPILLRQLLSDPLAQGQGLLARCLIAEPVSLAGHRPYREVDPLRDPAVEAYNRRIRVLLATSPEVWPTGDGYELKPRDLPLCDEARRLWIAFYDAIEIQQAAGSELETARPFASKAAEHAARIAAIITLVEDPGAPSVTAQAMDGAIQLTAFYLNEHLRLTGAGRQERVDHRLRTLLAWMQKIGPTIPKADILQKCPRSVGRNAATINPLLSELAARGYIREVGTKWEVRPNV